MMNPDSDEPRPTLVTTIVYGFVIVLVGLYFVLAIKGSQTEIADPQFVSIDSPMAPPEEDIGLLKMAAESGDPQAQSELGAKYYLGGGVKRDLGHARKWNEKAANHGVKEAQENLASMYYRGDGAERDIVRAYAWYKVAADNGSYDAQHQLIHMPLEMTKDQVTKGKELAATLGKQH